MKKLGFTLIILGFLAASWVASQDATEINWMWFGPTVLAALAGVAIVRVGTKQQMEHADTVAANIDDIDKSLANIVEIVTRLNREKEMINTYDMRHKIDELLLDDIDRFVEARETIGTKYGLSAYADIMSHFAAGERYLNRVWSCSADGYIDEVNTFIARAEDQFNETLEKFHQVRAEAGG